jgi:hypothetical protein
MVQVDRMPRETHICILQPLAIMLVFNTPIVDLVNTRLDHSLKINVERKRIRNM